MLQDKYDQCYPVPVATDDGDGNVIEPSPFRTRDLSVGLSYTAAERKVIENVQSASQKYSQKVSGLKVSLFGSYSMSKSQLIVRKAIRKVGHSVKGQEAQSRCSGLCCRI